MKKPKHTEGVMSLMEFTDSIQVGNFEGENTRPVCEVYYSGGQDEEDKANAEFIMKAWNSHYELLEALKDIYETFKGCLGGSDPLHYEDFEEDFKKVDQLIKKAEAKI